MKRMDTSKRNTLLVAATAAALTVLAMGCKNDKNEEAQNALFKPDGQERVSKFVDVQASNGARADGMLYAYHFTGGHLNSLGRSKVLLMLEDCGENCEPTVVHLVDAGEGDLLAQRKASVELYLKTVDGPNKLAFHPAAPNMLRFAKTESGSLDSSGDSSSASSAGVSGGGPTSPPPAGASSSSFMK